MCRLMSSIEFTFADDNPKLIKADKDKPWSVCFGWTSFWREFLYLIDNTAKLLIYMGYLRGIALATLAAKHWPGVLIPRSK